MRRSLIKKLCVGLNVDELEYLLVDVIPNYTNDEELVTTSQRYHGLSSRYRSHGFRLNDNESDEIIIILSEFLMSSSQTLPLTSVAQIHTFLGLIKGEKNLHKSAGQSFLKALYLYNSKSSSSILTSLTAHRLALAYANDKDYQNAIRPMEKAIEGYHKEKLGHNSDILKSAKDALEIMYKSRPRLSMQFVPQRLIRKSMVIPEDVEVEWPNGSRRISSPF